MHARVSCAGTMYPFLTCWTFARYCWTRLLFCEATAGVFFISPGTENFPMLPKGEPMAGQFYPMLFEAEKALGDLAADIPTVETA